MTLHPNLDPELREALERAPLHMLEAATLTPEAVARHRAELDALLALMPPPGPGVVVEERRAPGPGGDVRLRVHLPAAPPPAPSSAPAGRPCLYWIHGGGMVFGRPEMDDGLLAGYVERLGCVAVSVDYRLAPEHPHPAPVEDCYAGLVWTAANAAVLGADPSRLAVAGMSAGGGLAAATTLLARDRGGPPVAFQLLAGPMLDDRGVTPSSRLADAPLWDGAANAFGWRSLLGERAGGADVSPYAAPARATDLAGLPPAFVDVTELEIFRDEALDYARRLAEAGVSTEFHLYPGGFHGFEVLLPDTELGRAVSAARLAALRRAFRTGAAGPSAG
ncbi:alpha/beta hydrolase [Nonomuraea roseoviolacea]|uniref:Acetyl esterase/lipase n=1 Tax=Nonomuraea roseoviolacea subsp. carminata TaxID=160689 RepID=A0ABT1JTN7_9ACTN|nr:alpha/beta hydrolase [Nonomuraea roseoviolacea]MCP2345080.1 acetyl esterase/lipase [Nonomuraea roseoviolacea subsp. carminata]